MRRIVNWDTDPGHMARLRDQSRAHNQVMIYVLQACSELGVECTEVWASAMKCVYRLRGQSEDNANWFFFSPNADYRHVRDAVHDAITEAQPAYDPVLWAAGD